MAQEGEQQQQLEAGLQALSLGGPAHAPDPADSIITEPQQPHDGSFNQQQVGTPDGSHLQGNAQQPQDGEGGGEGRAPVGGDGEVPAHLLVAGAGEAMQALRELIGWPVRYAREAETLGVVWPRGLLLHGPPGCGKTLMVRAVAAECGAVLHVLTASDVYGAFVGQSERRLREAFEAAARDAKGGKVAVVFLDEVDALCPRRDAQRAHESRVVAQLLTLLDGVNSHSSSANRLAQTAQPPTATASPAVPPASAGDPQQPTQQGNDTPAAPAATPPLQAHLPPPTPQATIATAAPTVAGSTSPPTLATGGAASARGVGHLVVVGATNRPNALDPALRRPGRLDREIMVSVPNAAQRAAILACHTSGIKLGADVDLQALAEACHGYSGADLAALAREATLAALAEAAGLTDTGMGSWSNVGMGGLPEAQAGGAGGVGEAGMQAGGAASSVVGAGGPPARVQVVVGAAHVKDGMRRVGPSIVRGIEAEVPTASWDDIGGLDEVKRRLRQSVEWPLKHRAAFQRLGLSPPRGVLLYGVPGCSKTSLARAAAAASGATLLPLSCAQLFSMYVGEGESMLRDVFRRARLAAPSIVLLDEVDAVAARRAEGGAGGGSGGSESGVRLLTTLLTEMDGMEEAQGVLVLATTNRPDAVDAALMRPGRFDTLLYVPPPDQEGRLQVLRLHTRAMPLAGDVDLAALAAATADFTGAELAGLCREAALAALREDFDGAQHVAARHFEQARGASNAPANSPLTLAALAGWAEGRRRRPTVAA